MPLTQLQQEFLKKYVSSYWPFSKPKEKRAERFSQFREKLLSELNDLPESSRHHFMRDISNADKIGEQLKFNRATKEMEIILSRIRKTKIDLDFESSDKNSSVNKGAIEQLRKSLEEVVDDYGKPGFWRELMEQESTGKDLSELHKKVTLLLDNDDPTTEDLNNIRSLISQISIKRNSLEKRNGEIKKLKHRLNRDALLLKEHSDLLPDETEKALMYSEIPVDEWTEKMRQDAFSIRLKLTLALAQKDDVKHKDLKLTDQNKRNKNREIVYAVRRKYATTNSNNDEGNQSFDKSAPNFQMIVKPITREISVGGYVKGSGGNREALGSILSNKLSEQLGIDFRTPETHLLEVDGKSIGLPENGNVLASVQTFSQDAHDLKQRAQEKYPDNPTAIASYLDEQVDKREIQNLAVFDLISLNTDRHTGNAMITDDNKLIPIDHGAILPSRKALDFRFRENFLKGIPLSTKTAEEPLPEDIIVALENIDINKLRESLTSGVSDKVEGSIQQDIASGINMSCRSAEFMKFAARHLTLKEIYLAIGLAQEFIFDSPEDKKIEGFREAINLALSHAEDLNHFGSDIYDTGLVVNIEKNSWSTKYYPELVRLGWVTTNIPPADRQLLGALAALRQIMESKIKAPNIKASGIVPSVPPVLAGQDKLWQRFWALGGTDAVKKRGIYTGGIKLNVDHEKVFLDNKPKEAVSTLTQLVSKLEASFIATLGRF